MAKVKVRLKEVFVLDDNSVGVLLDADNVKDPQKLVDSINGIRDWKEGSIDIWDLIKLMFTIWRS